ncbi:MAG: DbpA RNA binding domain-containing protein [Saprospiraceae bacterium]|nr:DbpA RNA binding domain-containing protein [Saprospiraceae bacterium]
MDNLDKKELLWFLQDETGVSKSQINDMDMKSSFSFFEVDSTLVADRLRKRRSRKMV